MAEQLITDATGGPRTSRTFRVSKIDLGSTLHITGSPAAGDVFSIQISGDGGTTFRAYVKDSQAQQLTPDNTDVSLNGIGLFNVTTTSTTGSTGVSLSQGTDL